MEHNTVSWLGEEAKIFVEQIHEMCENGLDEDLQAPISILTQRITINDLLHG